MWVGLGWMGGLEVVAWELVEAEVVDVEEVEGPGGGGGGGGEGVQVSGVGGVGVSMDAKVPTSVHNQCVTNHGMLA